MSIVDSINKNVKIGFFESIKQDKNFVGKLYDLNYEIANVLVNDYQKNNVHGIPHGSLLMAIYYNENTKNIEGILLRVIDVADIPQKKEIVASMTDRFIAQKNIEENANPDPYTKNFYQFSGLRCRTLGTFSYDKDKKLVFGTDVENFLSPHNYQVYKPEKEQLKIIVNENAKLNNDEATEIIGELRYSSSKSYDLDGLYAPEVLLRTNDIVARRTAFFGMTRTGKSNTIKIIISAIQKLNKQRNEKIGQIIFDINGEYTFKNEQDDCCIYDKFSNNAVRFTTSLKKANDYEDVNIIQYNFYNDDTLEESFNLLSDEVMGVKNADYFSAFFNVKLFEDIEDRNSTEYRNQQRKRALYKCILKKANFDVPSNYKIYFSGFTGGQPVNSGGLTIDEAIKYFDKVDLNSIDEKYKKDEDWNIMFKVFKGTNASGFKALMRHKYLHSQFGREDYKQKIDTLLRVGKIVLVDLSNASTETQQKYIDKLCTYIFSHSMDKFTNGEKPEYIQMYFEEAHNIFPKDDKDLKNIYNRLAKEGAKLQIGISYSTQEVSSISPSILKNTQNWFISHLNNKEEIKKLNSYYDFEDFSNNILRNSDVGFARVKTYSNNFIIPVQINKFEK